MIAERVLLVGLVFAYLLTFDQVLPHGDALRIVRQVETAHLVWNPNHLFFDPLGYAIAWMANVRDREGVLEIFERVSIFATLVSLWVFHAVLVRAAVGRWARVVLCIGLFASASFLAVAGSQYYFMVQMPLLIAALYLYIDFIIQRHEERAVYRNIYGIGVLLALATAVMFNNLLLVIGAGVAVGFTGRSLKRPDLGLSLRLFLAAGLVGFPLFILGYSLAAAESGFLRWLASYEGDSGSVLNDFYGISWTLVGVAEAAARAAFNYALGNVVEHAGLGTVLWVFAFGQAVEFVPQWSRIMLGLVAIPPAVLMTGWATLFALRRAATSSLARFLLTWTGAFITFNILWNCNDAIFWFQILPATWLLVAMSMGLLSHRALLEEPARTPWMSGKWATTLLGALVGLLLIVNTGNLVMPLADRDYYVKQAQHAALLRDGDLEIVPGWDQQKWMSLPSDAPKAQQVVLMSLGLSGGDSLASMPDRIQSQLESGGRVVVARLFDIDSDLMPWYALHRLGWPRSRIQGLLSGYCSREIGRVGGVVFRELHRCAGASGGGN